MTWWPDGDNDAGRIALSALEHYAYCPRQAALIHVEGVFTDDGNTVRGQLAHERVDKPGVRATAAPGMRQHYAVPVWSRELGLYGRCDVVEIGHGTAVPVEHKIGRYQPHGPADVQVAAQAICLREMLDLDVPYGEIFTHADRRRHRVPLTDAMLSAVGETVAALRSALTAATLPPPAADRRCRRCSLLDDCLPKALNTAFDLYSPRPLGDWNA
ncbi:CRISPR-associated protein Cas4 [Micromonospora endophytica]|uniref:CRISPR-associated exonuclease Cas4 n=1 Tax=Micromonospora endophytica TaxID=515350 RepID=A0A2W2CTW4_9ACTN|nr:CRISPR-associated protein Cas4 [Micromonospora endophytica]PZF91789.1 CRISPR-associated protein Cas4 [Micromonospora endophytica]RIW40237.1 CRISPR-associated protein Cas4 [Micromonospora endophytica]BCJ58210.1 CRISPR-associated protein Cas4 [Micromonospora endophytica]